KPPTTKPSSSKPRALILHALRGMQSQENQGLPDDLGGSDQNKSRSRGLPFCLAIHLILFDIFSGPATASCHEVLVLNHTSGFKLLHLPTPASCPVDVLRHAGSLPLDLALILGSDLTLFGVLASKPLHAVFPPPDRTAGDLNKHYFGRFLETGFPNH